MSGTEGPKRGRKKGEPEQPETPAATDAPGEDPGAQPAPTEPSPAANPWHPINAEAPQRRSANIEDILRQRRGGAGRSLPDGLPRSWIGLAALGVVSAWLLSTSIHVLAQGERGIVTTFGRYAATIGPGLNFTLPWPVQAVERREVGKELVTLLPDKEAETLMLTRDGELIDLRLQVRWRVADLRLFSFAFPDGEAALRRLADSTIRAAVAEMTFDELRGGKRQAELQQRVARRLQRLLDAMRSGVTIAGIEVTGTNPPAKLADTFKQIGKASDDARKNHERAVAYAGQIKLTAEAEAVAFDKAYALYRIAPDVTRARIYYETMEKVLRNNQVVLGGSGGGIALPPAQDAKAATPATPVGE